MTTESGATKRPNGGVKTLAIRLEPDVHAQLTPIAQLQGTTITEEIRQALIAHISHAKENSSLASQAESAMAEIERDAELRRQAIATMFGDGGKPKAPRSR